MGTPDRLELEAALIPSAPHDITHTRSLPVFLPGNVTERYLHFLTLCYTSCEFVTLFKIML